MNRKIVAESTPMNQDEAIDELIQEMKASLYRMIECITFDAKFQIKINYALEKDNLWEAALLIGDRCNDSTVAPDEIVSLKTLIVSIRETMGELARLKTDPTTVVFGTSGWRGKIGEDFTVRNVHKVTRAIIDMMKSEEFLNTNGYKSFEEVQKKGIVVFRDNRFMGDEFMAAAMKELTQAGIKIYSAGECPTGVGSAVVTELGAAGSINFTPSHNPMDYAGLKFNPGDGGPADTDLTNSIMKESEKYMMPGSDFVPATNIGEVKEVDAAKIYVDFIEERYRSYLGVINLGAIRQFLRDKKSEIYLLVDNMHGSSRGYIQKILGKEVMTELEKSKSIEFINTNDDPSFHGAKPEPNEKNQKIIINMAKKKVELEPNRKMTLVVSLDPDADRIRFGTADADINMNQFGAIAYGYMLKKGYKGAVATTLPSSKFAVALARESGQEVHEVLVGFKHFRSLKDALVKYEESDGISFWGHTLEKDGIAGFLMALQVMAMDTAGTDIYSFFKELQKEAGYYYAMQSPREVKEIKIDEWKQLRKNVEKDIQDQFKDVKEFMINGVSKKVISTRIDDGIMMVFEDNSWLLVRSSGTEPKFRVYYEITSPSELTPEQVKSIQGDYAEAGLKILNTALAKYGK